MTIILRFWWVLVAAGSTLMREDGLLGHAGNLLFLAGLVAKVDHQQAWLIHANDRINKLYMLAASRFLGRHEELKAIGHCHECGHDYIGVDPCPLCNTPLEPT